MGREFRAWPTWSPSLVEMSDWFSHYTFDWIPVSAHDGMREISSPSALFSIRRTVSVHDPCRICHQRAHSMDGALQIRITGSMSSGGSFDQITMVRRDCLVVDSGGRFGATDDSQMSALVSYHVSQWKTASLSKIDSQYHWIDEHVCVNSRSKVVP
jgi:hypothetical protein